LFFTPVLAYRPLPRLLGTALPILTQVFPTDDGLYFYSPTFSSTSRSPQFDLHAVYYFCTITIFLFLSSNFLTFSFHFSVTYNKSYVLLTLFSNLHLTLLI